MPFTLKPHQLVAHWIPGFVALAVVLLADLKSSHSHFQQIVEAIGKPSAGLAFAVAAFAVGQFLDAFRNIIEELIGKISPKHAINWDFIWEFNNEKLERMDDFYFTYYVFDFNLALALVIGFATEFLPIFCWHLPRCMIWCVFLAIIVFVVDGLCLRRDIVKLSNGLPRDK
jgi:hypothetical protein